MATVLAVLGTPRKRGSTATLLDAAVEGARTVKGVRVEKVNVFDFKPFISPCVSCYNCIRDHSRQCTLPDAMGRNGKGELYVKVLEANGLLVGDPVHMWSPSSAIHVFMERLYPSLFTGKLIGLPFASISCASNQGMMNLANKELCKWAFTYKMRYVGGLPVHLVFFEDALNEAKFLGVGLAEAAKDDEKNGRKSWNDRDSWFYYMDKPWNALEPYLDNLTKGTFTWEKSLIEYGLRHSVFKKRETVRLLKKAREEFIKAMKAYKLSDKVAAQEKLVRASAYWTHATAKEFGERTLKAKIDLGSYRPLPE